MPADFKAVMGDLTSLARTLHEQARAYRELGPSLSPPGAVAATPGWTRR